MDSPFDSGCSDSDCSCGEPTSSRTFSEDQNSSGGILLLGQAQKAPEVLELDVKSDSDDSEDEVILLGEKQPTYEEITLEEDDTGDVVENVVEKKVEKRLAKHLQEILYHCPNCEKSFRVESLLKFHIRMHGVVESPLTNVSATDNSSLKSSSISQEERRDSTHVAKENKKSGSKRVSSKLKTKTVKNSTQNQRRVKKAPKPTA